MQKNADVVQYAAMWYELRAFNEIAQKWKEEHSTLKAYPSLMTQQQCALHH